MLMQPKAAAALKPFPLGVPTQRIQEMLGR
jgi:hypothetical protein